MSIPKLPQFETHQKEAFSIHFNDAEPGQCLVKEITIANAPVNAQGEQQFSVVFSSADPKVYEQGVYPVSHPELGDFDLFLVPIYGDDSEVHYEAVFT
ncbi:DUF6916 family protein [Marinicella sediminis]|uniref:DUF6916 family protein n=1 Tax=Marinicella sediminis TaxID=1792834 RepID=A0ABV7J9H5_9GAMM|nr:hypothetical protein [Marinicella sediminis]